MALYRFEDAETVQRATKRPRRLLRIIRAQTVSRDHLVDDVYHLAHGGDQIGMRSSGVAVGDGVEPGVHPDEGTPCVCERHDGVVARETNRGGTQLFGEKVACEEAELMVDVVDPVDVFVQG
ncbi:hypothetical protein D9M68_941640 [compost metagenome]